MIPISDKVQALRKSLHLDVMQHIDRTTFGELFHIWSSAGDIGDLLIDTNGRIGDQAFDSFTQNFDVDVWAM